MKSTFLIVGTSFATLFRNFHSPDSRPCLENPMKKSPVRSERAPSLTTKQGPLSRQPQAVAPGIPAAEIPALGDTQRFPLIPAGQAGRTDFFLDESAAFVPDTSATAPAVLPSARK